MKDYILELNKDQREAALTTEGPVLILAGAGSGKTKTIIARTIHILETKPVTHENILVMTFTNKAAREMKERGQKLLGSGKMPDFTTFHSWCVRFIKSINEDLLLNEFNRNRNFTILDQSEQEKMIDNLKFHVFSETYAKEFSSSKFSLTLGNIQNNRVPYNSIEQAYMKISQLYNDNELELYCPYEVNDRYIEQIAELYVLYKQELARNNSFDFEDLINISIDILEKFEDIRNFIQNKYKYIMVDEFQDTNGTQFKLLENILNKERNICVVGDDSQSIYGWRGAKIAFILNFHKHFSDCKIVNLSTNYRSRPIIVERANKLLKSSTERHKEKVDLQAHSKQKGLVKAVELCTQEDEAEFIAQNIKAVINKGANPGDIAILYRSAFIAQKIEEQLIMKRIPYKIHNGRSLLERNIAKALIAYLKALKNEENNLAFSMLFELTGLLTKERSSKFYMSIEEDSNFYEFLKNKDYERIPRITKKIKNYMQEFIEEYEDFKKMNYRDFVDLFSKDNMIKRYLEDDVINGSEAKRDKAMSNLNVLNIIFSIMSKYDNLDSLLETLSLEGEEEDIEKESVNLMTIHASKGLEFNIVFCIGAVEGIFPNENKSDNLEEERRLFYVAITRAKSSLILTCPKQYMLQKDKEYPVSRFVFEANIDIENKAKNCKKQGYFSKRKFY